MAEVLHIKNDLLEPAKQALKKLRHDNNVVCSWCTSWAVGCGGSSWGRLIILLLFSCFSEICSSSNGNSFLSFLCFVEAEFNCFKVWSTQPANVTNIQKNYVYMWSLLLHCSHKDFIVTGGHMLCTGYSKIFWFSQLRIIYNQANSKIARTVGTNCYHTHSNQTSKVALKLIFYGHFNATSYHSVTSSLTRQLVIAVLSSLRKRD